jgi:bifunctional UDP-N-acetylglucosamine pyrophosphorylase/glucosamine-1-phosphate N-acetyltransferase
MSSPLEIVILAAGQGTRMRSSRPKVLHAVGGKPLLAHVVATARSLAPRAIHIVYGHGGEAVRAALPDPGLRWVHQAEQHGTGHALAQALPAIADDSRVLVLYGDVPLIRAATLAPLAEAAEQTLALLTAGLDDPRGYGRVVRDAAGRVTRIVEHKDARGDEHGLREVNTGFLAARAARLKSWVTRLTRANAQGEYYLTDIIAMAVGEGLAIATFAPEDASEILGINTLAELARVERLFQNEQARRLMENGVTLRDPARLDVRGELACGRDVVIDVNVVIEGKVVLGDGVTVGPNNYLRDVTIGAGTRIFPNCVIEEAEIGAGCRVGPFARLRPGNRIGDEVHIGNFVEVKNSRVGRGSKMNHLSYIGDTEMGGKVNVGAGTITCNYDGANKHKTVIGDNVFIGSNAALVAPVAVGDGATLGAGTVLVKDAPAGELTLSRAEQKTVKGWKRPVKTNKNK